MRPRVLQVSAGLIPSVGGPFASTLGLCEGFGGLDVDRQLVGPVELPGHRTEAHEQQEWLLSNFPLAFVESNMDPRVRIQSEFREALESGIPQCDYVIAHGWFTAATRVTATLATRFNVPCFIQLHGSSADSGSVLRRLRRKAFNASVLRPARRATGAIVASDAERADFSRWGLDIPVFTLRYALPPAVPGAVGIGARVEAILDAVRGEPAILFVGRVVQQERLDILIRAVAALEEKGMNSHLLVARPSDEATMGELRETAIDAGVAGRVHFTGPVWGDEK